MKIAFIHNLPSGGGKRSAFEFVRHLTRHHEIDLYHIDEASEDYLDLRPLVNRTYLTPGPKPRRGIGVLTSILPAIRAYRAVAVQVNAGGYDVAFVMQCKLSNSPAVLRYLQVPSLYFCHEPLARTLEPHFWADAHLRRTKRTVVRMQAALDRSNARHATLLCANSHFSVESLFRAYGVYPRYSQLGVDTDSFRPLGIGRERVVLAVGALHPCKALDLILDASARLVNPPPVRFLFNSSAKGYREHLQSLANRHGVSVSFAHLVGESDLVDAYNRAAVVAYPSCLEPFGFVPLEAMACGAPVVGVADGGVRETVLDGKTGFLTERNASAFSHAIDTILRDAALGQRMGSAGRQYVLDNWSWNRSASILEGHLFSLLNQTPPGSRLHPAMAISTRGPAQNAEAHSQREIDA